MKMEQRLWTNDAGWVATSEGSVSGAANLAIIFGSTAAMRQTERLKEIQALYPKARLIGCSTAGEICQNRVLDDSLVATATAFDSTDLRVATVHLTDAAGSREAGRKLADALGGEGLAHVLVLSDGLKVNGSELVQGLAARLPSHVAVTGGLSGDGARFEHTLVCAGPLAQEGQIVAIGLYGSKVKVGYGSMGGWDSFGLERVITRSKGNVLYELDGQSALELYKRYLGEHAAGLPATGLLFPLSVRSGEQETAVVRTILAIDEKEQSMTFAGDIPQGATARLMKANFERLIDGAMGAAHRSHEGLGLAAPDLAILISCVGRKLVLKQRIEEEVEGVRSVLGPKTVMTGFYSYGEISPFTPSARCELHNQTMTITTISER